MKIIFVESYPQVVYGQQNTLLSLLGVATEHRHESLVVCTAEGPFCDELRNIGLEPAILPYPSHLSTYGGAIYRYGWRRKLSMLKQLAGYVLNLRQWLKSHRPDVVFCNDMRGLLTMGVAARLAGIPVVIWDKLDKPHGVLDWFQLPLVKLNIIISDAVKKKYPAWQKLLFSKRIVKVYDGAYLDRFYNIPDVRHELGLKPEHVALAMVGSINQRKAQDRLLRIVPELVQRCPQTRVLLIGEPDDNSQPFYASLPNLDHPCVIQTGFRSDMPAVMRSIDILLILSRQEGMGLVTVEAMAAGKPVIGTRSGGIPEVVIDDETGFLVDGDDDAALLAAIEKLCYSKELREKMGLAGRERAQACFDRPKQHGKVIKMMEKLGEARQ